MPSSQMNPAELSLYLDANCRTLGSRQRTGLKVLTATARESQAPILAVLERLEAQGLAANIRPSIVPNCVTVELATEAIPELSKMAMVEELRESAPRAMPREDDQPRTESSPSVSRVGVEENLRYVGADSMWRMGYTGKGRVVLLGDGGDVRHPAIGLKWKGWDGDTTAAWYTTRPWLYPLPYNSAHGTNSFGILVGSDDLLGDTIGVALDARWISSEWGDEWNWIVDPDSDPNTTTDVPDVLVISRGSGEDCDTRAQDELDLIEALGIVVVAAAGNFGPGPQTVWGVGGYSRDSLTNFAVGSIDHRSGDVRFSSGRGPSSCDGLSIKPNLTAPGVMVRTATTGSGYAEVGGTSFAAPHVGGAVALLRQAFPNTTARDIKEALLAGCRPMGSVSPNNDWGWGILNIPESYEFLRVRGHSQYAVDLARVDQAVGGTDDTLVVTLKFQNRGARLTDIIVRLDGKQPGFTCLSTQVELGELETAENRTAELRLVRDDTVFSGQVLPLSYRVSSRETELPAESIDLTIGGKSRREYFTHNTGTIRFSITNTGQFGYGFGEIQQLTQWVGFRVAGIYGNILTEASLLVATDSQHVSDGNRTATYRKDDDWWASNLDTLEIAVPGLRADEESRCIFWDGAAERPIGVSVEQRSFSFKSVPDDRFIILEYRVRNEGSAQIDNLFVGMFFDWSIADYWPIDRGQTIHRFDQSTKTVCNDYTPFVHLNTPNASFGTSVVSDQSVSSARAIELGTDGADYGLSEAQKFEFLAGKHIDTLLTEMNKGNLAYTISVGPFALPPGKAETVAFAVVAAASPQALTSVARRARLRYLNSLGRLPVPERFAVEQNYPNPFNSVTVIPVDIRMPGHARLDIFNLLGQHVTTVLDRDLAIGQYKPTWDGKDRSGEPVASGMYFAKISFEGSVVVRKMLLIK